MDAMEAVAEQQRDYMREAERSGLDYIGPCPAHLAEAWIEIPLPDGRTNRTRVVWPRSSHAPGSKNCPLIVYMHGGGYYTCSPDLVLAPARGFAQVLGAVVACPTLDQLPGQPFPAPIQAAWDVCAWLSDAANLNDGLLKHEEIAVDLSRGFVVGGVSSGGTAAAIISALYAAASAGVPGYAQPNPIKEPFTGAFVGLPFLVTEQMLPEEYKGQLLSRRDAERTAYLEALIGTYLHTPWFSPLNFGEGTEKLAGTHPPKIFTYSTSLDVFRDDAAIYNKWLARLPGTQRRLVEVPDEDHVAWVSPTWPASHTRKIKEITLDGMGWLLGREWDRTQELPT